MKLPFAQSHMLQLVLVALFFFGVTATAETNICPALVGTTIPDVKVLTPKGEEKQLAAVFKEKKTVLVIYRGGWWPYCNTQLGELARIESKLKSLGYQIVAISPDIPSSISKSIEEKKLGYRLFSDPSFNLVKTLGVAFEVPNETISKYKEYGIELREVGGKTMLPVPGVFLVDTQQKIRFTYVNPDYKTRLKSDILLAAAKAVP